MIISNKAAVQRVARVYQEQHKSERVRKPGTKAKFNDEVTLSTEGKEMQAMLDMLKAAPDIRPQAEELKVAVENGTYKVSARQIARGILNSSDRS